MDFRTHIIDCLQFMSISYSCLLEIEMGIIIKNYMEIGSDIFVNENENENENYCAFVHENENENENF